MFLINNKCDFHKMEYKQNHDNEWGLTSVHCISTILVRFMISNVSNVNIIKIILKTFYGKLKDD